MANEGIWPELGTEGWLATCQTMRMWSQVIGKTKLSLSPMINHWWQVPLYVSARGLTSAAIPDARRGIDFEVEMDLVAHRLEMRASDGTTDSFPLVSGSLAEFYQRYLAGLDRLGVRVHIYPVAVEIPETVYLDRDQTPRVYDPDWAHRFHLALVPIDRVLKEFRGQFVGKASPVHFFWGSFDLAVTRFSGRTAPIHPGGSPHLPDYVAREAYSHELSSAGFWPGDARVPEAAFYSYAYPEPPGFSCAPVKPEEARYDPGLGEYLLPYETVRQSSDPERALADFLESTYVAAAELGRWDRDAVERRSAA